MIYDKFVQDAEWQRLNEALHQPGITYKERDALRGALDVREDAIRKKERQEFNRLVNQHKDSEHEKETTQAKD